MEVFRLDLNLKLYQPRKVFRGVVGTWWVIVRNYFVFKVLKLLLSSLCSRPCPGQLQKTARCVKKLLVILRSQGLDLEIDSTIGRYHYHPPTRKLFWIQ